MLNCPQLFTVIHAAGLVAFGLAFAARSTHVPAGYPGALVGHHAAGEGVPHTKATLPLVGLQK
jgi:hypothetical protein